ncbi:MAG: electron transfer flavoprotein subunit alpha/FixB family protein [Acidimicrobiia bacterium]|nr:electron transfer flavoprotein subunit alpha/FixB family protein [Acidimicrobiia bacterium]
MPGAVWVIAEQWRGGLSEVTYELLALGRQIADDRGAALEAVLLGSGVVGLAESLGLADRVLYADSPAFAEPVGEVGSRALAALATERKPTVVLVPITNVSWDLVGLLPARLGVPLVNFCMDVAAVGDGLEARCLVFGGKMEVRAVPESEPVVIGVLPGARRADAGRSTKRPEVEPVAAPAPETCGVRLLGYEEPEAGDIDITQQEVLVSVGRGLQGQANLDLAEELAELLGGAVSASRPAVDMGWLPMTRQVGKSGMLVKPKLYIALGISGAPEHVEGMKDAALIVAVNTDPGAPIFNVAHYGVAEDLLEFVPVLIDKVKEHKS